MLNKMMILGNVGKQPEQAPSYDKLVTFSVATTEYTKDKSSGEFKEHTEWHKIKCFGYVAEKALKLGKGSKVYLEGKFRSDDYEKDGVKRKAFYILCDKLVIIEKTQTVQAQWDKTLEKPLDRPTPELTIDDEGFTPWQ